MIPADAHRCTGFVHRLGRPLVQYSLASAPGRVVRDEWVRAVGGEGYDAGWDTPSERSTSWTSEPDGNDRSVLTTSLRRCSGARCA